MDSVAGYFYYCVCWFSDRSVFYFLKSAFASSVIFVVILLSQFDRLKFFEGTIGESSAKDVLDIIEGRK